MADKNRLSAIVKNHIIEGQMVTAEQLRPKTPLKTATGHELVVKVQDDASLSIGGAKIVPSDLQASNGVIHVLDTVFIPGESAGV